jgi:hypothetical protein
VTREQVAIPGSHRPFGARAEARQVSVQGTAIGHAIEDRYQIGALPPLECDCFPDQLPDRGVLSQVRRHPGKRMQRMTGRVQRTGVRKRVAPPLVVGHCNHSAVDGDCHAARREGG